MTKENKEELNDGEKLMVFLMKKRKEGINHWGELRRLAIEKFSSLSWWTKKFEWTLLLWLVSLSEPKRFDEFELQLKIDKLKQKGKSFKEIAKKLKLPKRKVLWLWKKWDKDNITLKQKAEFYGISVSTLKRILKEKPEPKPKTRRELAYYIGDILYQIDSVEED